MAVSVYEHSNPWQLADAHLPKRIGQSRVMLGAGYSSRTTYDSTVTERTGSYIFWPEVLKIAEIYTLSQNGEGKVAITKEHFSPLVQVFALLIAITLCVVSWVYPLPKRVS